VKRQADEESPAATTFGYARILHKLLSRRLKKMEDRDQVWQLYVASVIFILLLQDYKEGEEANPGHNSKEKP